MTYCFPPCNLAPTRRVMGWVECLPAFGWYPIVVCRHWDPDGVDDPMSVPRDQHFRTEKRDGYEVHWVPVRPNLRDRMLQRFGESRMVLPRRMASYALALLDKLVPSLDSLRAYGEFVDAYLRDNRVDGMLVTGNPFVLFRVGFDAKRRHGVPWAADYRDTWTATHLSYPAGMAHGLLRRLDGWVERRWLQTASFFTTVSPEYVRKIRALVRRPGYAIYNGYSHAMYAGLLSEGLFPEFTVSYVGTLYAQQRIEVFLGGVRRFLEALGPGVRFRLLFPGLAYLPEQKERVLGLVRGYEGHVSITDRVPGVEALRIQARSHLLLQVGWESDEGVVGSKVFEYLGSGRPLVICPSDHGVLARTMERMRAGYVADTEEDVFQLLQTLYARYIEGHTDGRLEAAGRFYSREYQVSRLARCLTAYFRDPEAPRPASMRACAR